MINKVLFVQKMIGGNCMEILNYPQSEKELVVHWPGILFSPDPKFENISLHHPTTSKPTSYTAIHLSQFRSSSIISK